VPFRFKRFSIPGPVLVEPLVFRDGRGFFMELYKRTPFLAEGIPYDFVQVNASFSRRGVVRGLHYQLRPMEQGKLVTVLRGRILDVAVDVRRGSPWFGRYVSVELSAEKPALFWIPPGFAHGFQALEDSLVLYMVTKEYSPEHERCIAWDDPDIGIEWPLAGEAVLSEKDKRCPRLRDAETNFEYGVF